MFVIAKKEDQSVHIESRPVTEQHSVICMERLNYPYTALDRKNLEIYRKIIVESLKENLGNLESTLEGLKKLLQVIPNLGSYDGVQSFLKVNNMTLEGSDVLNLAEAFDQLEKEDLPGLISFSSAKWRKITHPDELMLLESNNRLILQKLNSLTLKIWNILVNPTSVVPLKRLESIKLSEKPTMAYTDSSGDMCFFLHFPEQKDINDITFPFRKFLNKFNIVDPNWIGFFKVSFPDILFSVLIGLNAFGYLIYFACEAYSMYKKKRKIVNFRKRLNSIPFQVRKMESSRRPSFSRQSDCAVDSRHQNTPEIENRPRRSRRSRKRNRTSRVNVDVERNIPTYQNPHWGLVRVINLDQPVGQGDSDISN